MRYLTITAEYRDQDEITSSTEHRNQDEFVAYHRRAVLGLEGMANDSFVIGTELGHLLIALAPFVTGTIVVDDLLGTLRDTLEEVSEK